MPRAEAIDRADKIRVFNRTADVLTVSCDGRQWDLQPGWGLLPSVVVPFALRQHPRLGTFGKMGLGGETLIAVEGFSEPDQFRLIAPGHEHLGKERLDRAAHPLETHLIVEDLPHQRNYAGDYAMPLAQESPDRQITFTNDTPPPIQPA